MKIRKIEDLKKSLCNIVCMISYMTFRSQILLDSMSFCTSSFMTCFLSGVKLRRFCLTSLWYRFTFNWDVMTFGRILGISSWDHVKQSWLVFQNIITNPLNSGDKDALMQTTRSRYILDPTPLRKFVVRLVHRVLFRSVIARWLLSTV